MKYLYILFGLLILSDLIFLNLKIFQTSKQTEKTIIESNCSDQCRQIVAAAISSIPTLPATASVTAGPSRRPTANLPPKKSFLTTYLPIPGEGSTTQNQWDNITGTSFWLNTADYPGLKEAYFESNLKLFNANGLAYLRLFDITAGVEVWGSEITTTSQNFVFLTSAKITVRPGNHQYVIQAKSLTADTTLFNSPRIKLILQN